MHTVNEKMSKVAKNNAKCEIFARYAEINSTDSIDKQSILTCFTTRAKIKYEILWSKVHFISPSCMCN